MFEGDSADTSAGKFPLMSMGGPSGGSSGCNSFPMPPISNTIPADPIPRKLTRAATHLKQSPKSPQIEPPLNLAVTSSPPLLIF